MQCWCLCFSFLSFLLSFFVACAMNHGHLYCYNLCTVVVHGRFLTRWPSSFAIVCSLFLCREGRSLTQWPSSLLQFVHFSFAGKIFASGGMCQLPLRTQVHLRPPTQQATMKTSSCSRIMTPQQVSCQLLPHQMLHFCLVNPTQTPQFMSLPLAQPRKP